MTAAFVAARYLQEEEHAGLEQSGLQDSPCIMSATESPAAEQTDACRPLCREGSAGQEARRRIDGEIGEYGGDDSRVSGESSGAGRGRSYGRAGDAGWDDGGVTIDGFAGQIIARFVCYQAGRGTCWRVALDCIWRWIRLHHERYDS